MTRSLPSLFVIGSSASLLWGPHLKEMTDGLYRYSRKGEEPSEITAALQDLDVPRGASAGDSAMVLDYLRALERTRTFRPDVVLMHVGAHDIKRDLKTGRNQVSLEAYRENISAIAEWFRKRKIKLVWIRSGPLDEKLHNAKSTGFHRYEKDMDDYNAAAETILAKHHVQILDLPGFTRRLGPMDQLLKDHVHFKEEIVRLQAAFIAGCLSQMA